ncbi:MAG: DUF5682 family protein [Acidimicrobiales bacterium]
MDTDVPTEADDVRKAAAGLLAPPVIYVPIRHHSPTCAHVVAEIIAEQRPCAVLVEGPPAFDDQIDFLVDPAARMPLAIYSHVTYAPVSEVDADQFAPAEDEVDHRAAEPIRRAFYHPFCDYSPETVALRSGRAIEARLGFIDLDDHSLARLDSSPAGHTDERRFEFSATLAAAAEHFGCRDHNELWDHMVEATDLPLEETVAAVLTYGSLARAGVGTEELRRDGTEQREFAMATRIAAVRVEMSSDPRPIVVVTGAFHSVALPALVDSIVTGTASAPVTVAPVRSVVDHGHGLIRYSFERLDALSGYAAGMPSPRWYQAAWEERRAGGTGAVVTAHRFISEVATEVRSVSGDGQPSLPSVVDAFVAAEQLSKLRNRRRVSRNDCLDAMVSCFTKGEDNVFNPVRHFAALSMTGTALGAPPGTPRVPLAEDFDRIVAALALPNDTTEPKQLHLDVYRNDRDLRRSRLLHGLDALGVVYGVCITPLRFSRAAGRDVVRERWRVRVDGSTDVSLTEASVWGAGVVEAVANKTRRELYELLEFQPSAAALMRLVMTAAQRGVPSVVAEALDGIRSRLAIEPSITDLVGALSEAELLWAAREPLSGSDLTSLPALAEQLYVRSCQLGSRLHETPREEWRATVGSLESLHRVITTDTWAGLDHELFWDMLADQRDRVEPGMLRGAIAGLEWRGGRIDDDHLLATTAGHLAPATESAVGGLFLAGLILVARDSLWDVNGMVRVLSDAFGSLDEEEFLRRVPSFRSAFAALAPRQTDRLAEIVTTITGSRANVRVSGVTAGEVLRHSLASATVETQLETDGLAGWMRP